VAFAVTRLRADRRNLTKRFGAASWAVDLLTRVERFALLMSPPTSTHPACSADRDSL
jgi:hypothetical protein